MIYITSFKNYDEFKEVFGLRECGNGNKSRMNKILLGCLKNREFFHYCRMNHPGFLKVANMADFKSELMDATEVSSHKNLSKDNFYFWEFRLGTSTYIFYVPNMMRDYRGGLCEDGDSRSIRYINAESDRVYKMRAGRFFTKIIESTEFGQHLPQQAKSWLGEEFLTSWQAYAEPRCSEDTSTFHYGNSEEDFEEIYSSEHRRGNFRSCMTDEGYHTMYSNSVDAHAAWLTDANGLMFARCVVWDDVLDMTTGKHLRLAERQYSDGVQDCYKKQLVDELISRGLIDGYKQIGASCHDNRAFVLNDGTSIADHDLCIDCDIDYDDAVSYMDSFVYYNINERVAYNTDAHSYGFELDTTNGSIEGQGNWSDYHDEYIPEDESVYVEHRDDYFYADECVEDVHDNMQFIDDCVECDQCREYILEEDAFIPEQFEDMRFCDEECFESWASNNGYEYSEYDEEYTREDVYDIYRFSPCGYWSIQTISESSLNDLIEAGKIHEFNGDYYLVDDEDSEKAWKNLTLPAVIYA